MDDPLQPEDCARRLLALADPVRLRAVEALSMCESTASHVRGRFGLSMVGLSHHLGVLRNAAIVERERRGRFVI